MTETSVAEPSLHAASRCTDTSRPCCGDERSGASLPFNCRWGFGRYVVDHAVDPAHFICDSRARDFQEFVRKAEPVGCHEVRGLDCAESASCLISAAVAHHADGLGVGEEHGEGLAQRSGRLKPGLWEGPPRQKAATPEAQLFTHLSDRVVQPGLADFLNKNGVRFLEDTNALPRDFANDADGQPRARKGVSLDAFFGKAQHAPQFADFVCRRTKLQFGPPSPREARGPSRIRKAAQQTCP